MAASTRTLTVEVTCAICGTTVPINVHARIPSHPNCRSQVTVNGQTNLKPAELIGPLNRKLAER